MAILYQRYSSLLYAFAYRIVADHQVAEDLLQESFLAVWQRASSYSPQLGAVYTWLAAITHHRAIDYVRSRRSCVVFTLGEVKTTSNAPSPDAWDEVWRSVQAAQVREAMEMLPAEQRQVIELAYFQGWTHAEIAAGCQPPLGTVKGRLRLGLIRMKHILAQIGV